MLWILMALAVYSKIRKEENRILNFAGFILIALFIITTVATFKWGSWVSYFTEWWTLVFILCGYYWEIFADIFNRIKLQFSYFLLSGLLIVKGIELSHKFYPEFQAFISNDSSTYDLQKKVADVIKANFKTDSGYVFINLHNPFHFFNNLLYREAILPQYEIVYFTTYNRRIFDYSDFRQKLLNGKTRFLVVKSVSGFKFLDIDITGFQLKQENEFFLIYERKQ